MDAQPEDFPFPDRWISFFGGKGGVGKTTMAAMAALRLAKRGHKTLLVSTDPAHSTSDILRTTLKDTPTEVADRFWGLEINPEREANDYIERVKDRIAEAAPPRLLGEVYRHVDLARVSPGAAEAALFDRFARLIDHEGANYDRIVFDTAPTGQTLRLLSLPELMTTWMTGLVKRRRKINALTKMWRNVAGTEDVVPAEGDVLVDTLANRRDRFARVRDVLTDTSQTAFIFVVIPMRLPIWETERAVQALTTHGVPVGAVVVNQVIPPDPGSTARAGPDASFLKSRRERQAEHLAQVSQKLGNWVLLQVFLQESDPVGLDALARIPVQPLEVEVAQ